MPEVDLTYPDLYAILGVGRNDPSGAIHQAFVKRLMKLAPRHKSVKGGNVTLAFETRDKGQTAEQIAALQMAYRTLMDPKAREQYDNLLACGTEIAGLVNQAFDALIKGRLRFAEQLILKVVEQTGGASEAMMLLGMVQYEQGHFHDAVHTMNKLVDRFPRIPLYRINLGNMLMNRYSQTEDKPSKDHILMRAREQFEKAVELDPSMMLGYIEIARSYMSENDCESAYAWTQKATAVPKIDEMANLEPLLYGVIALAAGGDSEKVREQVLRIERIVGDNEADIHYAVSSMVSATFPLVRDRRFFAAQELLRGAIRLDPKSMDLKAIQKDCDSAAEADRLMPQFQSDPKILPPVKEMASQFFDVFMFRSNIDRLENAADDFFNKLDKQNIQAIRSSLAYMKTAYASIWKLNAQFWDPLLGLTKKKTGFASRGVSYLPWLVITILLIRLLMYLFNSVQNQ